MTQAADTAAEQQAADNQNLPEESTTEETQIDWEAKAKELEQANVKLTNDNKSMSGRVRADRIDELFSMVQQGEDRSVALQKTVAAIGAATASGETDGLAENMLEIDKASAQTKAARIWQDGYTRVYENLFSAFSEVDSDGNAIKGGKIVVDIDVPEVKALTDKWTAAQEAHDLLGLNELAIEAHMLRRRIDRAKDAATAEEEVEAEKTSAKTREKKAGVNNNSFGKPSAGSGTGKSREEIEKSTNANDISDKEYEDYLAGG